VQRPNGSVPASLCLVHRRAAEAPVPARLRTVFDARLADLKDETPATFDDDPDEDTGSYTITFSEVGVIYYTISNEIISMTMIRLRVK
jgi:hypothetical protein